MVVGLAPVVWKKQKVPAADVGDILLFPGTWSWGWRRVIWKKQKVPLLAMLPEWFGSSGVAVQNAGEDE